MKYSANAADRLSRLQDLMLEKRVDLMAIAPTPNMRYLLGFMPKPDERICVLFVAPRGTVFVVPELNADQAEHATGMRAIRWTDDAGPLEALRQALGQLKIAEVDVLAVDDTMRADAVLILQDVIGPRKSMGAGELMTRLRIRKSPQEIEIMARAAAMADAAIMSGIGACRPGASEREVANVISDHFRQQGCEMVEFTIVASGANGAFPHYEACEGVLRAGDTVVIDVGATFNGYKSDVTRMVQLGKPTREVQRAYDAVLEANRRGREAAVAGARACDVDRAARASLEAAKYGPYFIHRTGHGLGIEIHEPPWITSSNETLLEPGMVFSIEPGVYVPGKFGIRIEDIVAVTEGECRTLTGVDRGLFILM